MQAVYQLVLMSVILWDGGRTLGLTPAEQSTFVFNTFVVLQLFNQVACRKAFDEPNFLDGLSSHRFFIGIVAAEATLQVPPPPPQPWSGLCVRVCTMRVYHACVPCNSPLLGSFIQNGVTPCLCNR